jgi:hypothetical protein
MPLVRSSGLYLEGGYYRDVAPTVLRIGACPRGFMRRGHTPRRWYVDTPVTFAAFESPRGATSLQDPGRLVFELRQEWHIRRDCPIVRRLRQLDAARELGIVNFLTPPRVATPMWPGRRSAAEFMKFFLAISSFGG